MTLHPTVADVTARIANRSAATRRAYLQRVTAAAADGPRRDLGCGNFAHGFAASDAVDKATIRAGRGPNIGIVTAYNDMLSAHQPYEGYPQRIRLRARLHGAPSALVLEAIAPNGYADEVAIVGAMTRPLAVLQGQGEQIVNPAYLGALKMPSIWRGQIQVVPGAGHAIQWEQAAKFDALLADFARDCGG